MAELIASKEALTSFFEKLHNLLWNEAGLNPEKALEHLTFFFAYRLIEPQVEKLGLPDVCRWSHIAAQDENWVFTEIRKGIAAFRSNPITKPFFFAIHEIKKQVTLHRIVREINTLPVALVQETDLLGDVFEYMLGRGMSTMSDQGQYFTMRAICRLAFELAYEIKGTVRRPDGSLCTFADFFCGTGGFPAEYVRGVKRVDPAVNWGVDRNSIFCADKNISSVTTTLLNLLILTGTPFPASHICEKNSFTDRLSTAREGAFAGLQVDYGFTNPPYGGDKTTGAAYRFRYAVHDKSVGRKVLRVNPEIGSIGIEDDDKVSAGVQLCMATLAPGGVECIVLPQGFFFAADAKKVALRRLLVEEYKVWYVVDISAGAFANTATKTSMLVFQKGVGPTERVRFLDMERRELLSAGVEELRAKKYSLNYRQYVMQEQPPSASDRQCALRDLVTFNPEKSPKTLGSYRYIDIASVTKGSVELGDPLPTSELPGRAKYAVRVGDILLSTVRPNLEHYLYISPEIWAEDLIVSNGFSVLRVKDSILPQYLYYNLIQPWVTSYLTSRADGTTYPVIDNKIIGDLEIVVPPLEVQRQIVEEIDPWASSAKLEEQIVANMERVAAAGVFLLGQGEIPRVPLSELVRVCTGKAITKRDAGGEYPVYGGGGEMNYTAPTFNRDGVTYKISNAGVSRKNCVMRIYGKFFMSQSGVNLEVVATDRLHPDYLGTWLLNNREMIFEMCARGTAQLHPDFDILLSLKIPLPPLEAQRELLDPIFANIARKQDNIAEYKSRAAAAIAKNIPGSRENSREIAFGVDCATSAAPDRRAEKETKSLDDYPASPELGEASPETEFAFRSSPRSESERSEAISSPKSGCPAATSSEPRIVGVPSPSLDIMRAQIVANPRAKTTTKELLAAFCLAHGVTLKKTASKEDHLAAALNIIGATRGSAVAASELPSSSTPPAHSSRTPSPSPGGSPRPRPPAELSAGELAAMIAERPDAKSTTKDHIIRFCELHGVRCKKTESKAALLAAARRIISDSRPVEEPGRLSAADS